MLSQQFLESVEKIKAFKERHGEPQWVKDLNPQLMVIKEWMMTVGPRGGKVWTNSKTGKKVYGKKPGKRDAKQDQDNSRTVANALIEKLKSGQKLNGGEIKSLASNLADLNHAELKQLKSELAPYRSGKSKSDLVENLVTEAKRRTSEAGAAERQAKKDERDAQKPKKEPKPKADAKSKEDAKPKGEETPKTETMPAEKPAEAPKAETPKTTAQGSPLRQEYASKLASIDMPSIRKQTAIRMIRQNPEHESEIRAAYKDAARMDEEKAERAKLKVQPIDNNVTAQSLLEKIPAIQTGLENPDNGIQWLIDQTRDMEKASLPVLQEVLNQMGVKTKPKSRLDALQKVRHNLQAVAAGVLRAQV